MGDTVLLIYRIYEKLQINNCNYLPLINHNDLEEDECRPFTIIIMLRIGLEIALFTESILLLLCSQRLNGMW